MSTLASTTVTVTRIGKHCGAEISGVDLSQPLDDETFAEIRDAFFENEVVFFRNQRLTPLQQVDFTRRFGELEHHVRKESLLAGFPEILVISNILDEKGNAIGSQDAGRFWHSDVSYKAQPSMLSALYALEVPITKDGTVLGHTKFASSTAAYDALPDTMKQYLAGKKNVHSYRDYRRKNLEAQKEELARGGRVIQEHAVTEEQLKRVDGRHAERGRRCPARRTLSSHHSAAVRLPARMASGRSADVGQLRGTT
jgi:taurine dioxygenase